MRRGVGAGRLTRVQRGDVRPGVREPQRFTPALTEFIDACCAVEPADRLSAAQLMDHDWLQIPDSSAGASPRAVPRR